MLTAPPTRTTQVRCCSDHDNGPGWTKRAGCSVWGGSDEGWECSARKTFAEAEAICQNNASARLCTVAELEDGCAKQTGCGFDDELVWGVQKVRPVVCGSPGQCSGETEGLRDTNELHAVRALCTAHPIACVCTMRPHAHHAPNPHHTGALLLGPSEGFRLAEESRLLCVGWVE